MMGLFRMSNRNSNSWISGLKSDLVGKNAHRTWIGLLTAAVTAYFAVYALFESRHDRQLQIALYERNTFITMVSSGNRGAFVAAMQNFGRIQNFEIKKYPPLFKPWEWFDDEKPNKDSLYRWARHRLPLCTPMECGDKEKDIRIDLRNVVWPDVYLPYVDLRGADFTGALLSSANLSDTTLCKANLKDVNLSYANLSNADILDANFTNAETWRVKLAHVIVPRSNLSAEQLRGARGLNSAVLDVDDGKVQEKCRE